MQLADEALSDAKYLLQDHRLKAAANRAYYAMFHAAQAALSSVDVRPPKTHKGAINLFGRHLIKTGKLNKEYSKYLQDAYDLRQQSDYGTDVSVGEHHAEQVLERAEAFVAEANKLI